MGFSCPVCDDPQADGVHLANHLAITALTRGGDHETFLDDHVPDWQELGEAELAEQLRSSAEQTEYPQVFEDTTGHTHADESDGAHASQADAVPFETDLPSEMSDGAADEVVEEAMELTRKRRANAEDEDDEPETE
jgi:hypothetical protein